jgi:1-deoxy-D-xylulose-5-phosphate reductoisomerase
VAVAAFLEGAIGWLQISDVIAEVLDGYEGTEAASVDVVLEADRTARRRAAETIRRRSSS